MLNRGQPTQEKLDILSSDERNEIHSGPLGTSNKVGTVPPTLSLFIYSLSHSLLMSNSVLRTLLYIVNSCLDKFSIMPVRVARRTMGLNASKDDLQTMPGKYCKHLVRTCSNTLPQYYNLPLTTTLFLQPCYLREMGLFIPLSAHTATTITSKYVQRISGLP